MHLRASLLFNISYGCLAFLGAASDCLVSSIDTPKYNVFICHFTLKYFKTRSYINQNDVNNYSTCIHQSVYTDRKIEKMLNNRI